MVSLHPKDCINLRNALLAVLLVPLALLMSCRRDHQETAINDLYHADFAFTVDDYLRAAREGNAEAIKWFISAGMSTDAENQYGEHALGLAAERAHGDIVKMLLDAGAEVNIRGPGERTALHGAAESGDAIATGALLNRGADPTLRDQDGWTALRLAAFHGHEECAGLLIPRSTESDLDSAMLLASIRGNVAVLDRLLGEGANVYGRTPEQETGLMLAAMGGHYEAVRLLLQHGANRFAVDPTGRTAAQLADEQEPGELGEMLKRQPRTDIAGGVMPSLEGSTVEPTGTVWRAQGARLDGDPNHPQPVAFVRYREEQLPVSLEAVDEEQAATLRLLYDDHRVIRVPVGEVIPETPFVLLGVNRRTVSSKTSLGGVEVLHSARFRDQRSGREFDMTPDDPGLSAFTYIDLVDAGGRTFRARRGDSFRVGSDGEEVPFRILELRPREVLVERLDTGAVISVAKGSRTLPLSVSS